MEKSFLAYVARFLKKQSYRKRWRQIVIFLASIVVFVTTYALILPAITVERTAYCGYEEHVHTEECYAGENGETQEIPVCGLSEHTHTDECYREQTDDTDKAFVETSKESPAETSKESSVETSKEYLVETNKASSIETTTDNVNQTTDYSRTYNYEDNKVLVKVSLPETSTVPKDAQLKVTSISRAEEHYDNMVKQAGDAVITGLAMDVRLYDVSFYTNDEKYINVSDDAVVSMEFKQHADVQLQQMEDYVAVVHFEENETQLPTVTDIVENEDQQLQKVTFETTGFSTYAVVMVQEETRDVVSDYTHTYTQLTNIGASDLNGKTVAIANVTNERALASSFVGNTVAISGTTLTVNSASRTDSGLTEWIFVQNGSGYRISTADGSTWLYVSSNTLRTTTTESSATTFTVSEGTGTYADRFRIRYSTYRYVRYYNGSFSLSTSTTQATTYQAVYEHTGVTANTTTETGLNIDGKSFVIANINGSRDYAMQSTSTIQSGRLDAKEVSVSSSGAGVVYVTAENDLTLWTFYRQSDGTYYIHTTIDDKIYYLNITATALSVSTSPQKITVSLGEGSYEGQVRLVGNGTSVDWYGNNEAQGNIFGPYNGTGANNYQVLAEPIAGGGLFYNLNLPSLSGRGTSWQSTISTDTIVVADESMTALNSKPTGYAEALGPAGEIYKKQTGVTDADNPYAGLYRMNIRDNYSFTDPRQGLNYLGEDYPYYKEYRFEGWAYTDDSGKEHLFAPNAPVTHNTDGTFRVEDTQGNTVVIPPEATFTGKWKQITSPAYYFVNYAGTILDTEGDVSRRVGSEFTPVVAVGTLFFGSNSAVGSDNQFGVETGTRISIMITSSANLNFDNENPQVVISHVTQYNGQPIYNAKAPDTNSNLLMEALLKWIRADDNMTIKVSTGDGTVRIDNKLATADNYSVRWYVMKEQTDGWHIDGVMSAETEELVIMKTFNGLTDEQIQAVLQNYKINIKVRYTDTTGTERVGTYMTLNTDAYTGTTLAGKYTDQNGKEQYGIEGQYLYNGFYTTGKAVVWTVRVLKGEHFIVEEEGFDVPESLYPANMEGYDVTTISMLDGDYRTMYFDVKAGYDIYKATGDKKYDIVGGETNSVSLTNNYTEKGKGILDIQKTITNTGEILQGAEFTLTQTKDSDGNAVSGKTQVVTTNYNGRAYFNNLEPGTYELKETGANVGYQEYDEIITVTVTEHTDSSGRKYVNVSANGTMHGDYGTGKTNLMLNIGNTLDPKTVVVVKDFEGISAGEIDRDLKDTYRIQVYDENGNEVELVDKANNKVDSLTFDNAARISVDGRKVYWNLVRLEPGEYTIVESGYRHKNYSEVSISSYYKDEESGGKQENLPVQIVDEKLENERAEIKITKEKEAGYIAITNKYGDLFDLRIRKVDSVNGKPLVGAVFKLYGSHEESTNTQDTIRYYDKNGVVRTLYYIGTTEPTDESGYAVINGLNLTSDDYNFEYILDEVKPPDGYDVPAQADENGIIFNKHVFTVRSEQTVNGQYEIKIQNKIRGWPLQVRKRIPQGAVFDADTFFEITIKISDPKPYTGNDGTSVEKRIYNYQVYDSVGNEVSGSGMRGSFSDESGKTDRDVAEVQIKLKADWYVVVDEVPENFHYTIVEKTDGDGDGVDDYRPAMSIIGNGSFDNNSKISSGTIVQSSDGNIVTVSNYTPDAKDITTSATVKKVWDPIADAADSVVMCLYQVQTNEDQSKTVRLYPVNGEATLSDANQWSYTWNDLPLYDDTGQAYNYYVREKTPDGWKAEYGVNTTQLEVDGSTATAALITGGTVIVTNIRAFRLPKTGGIGTYIYFMAGILIIAIAAFIYRFYKIGILKRKDEER